MSRLFEVYTREAHDSLAWQSVAVSVGGELCCVVTNTCVARRGMLRRPCVRVPARVVSVISACNKRGGKEAGGCSLVPSSLPDTLEAAPRGSKLTVIDLMRN